MRVLFYVQHLTGIGHLKRCSVIVRAMTGAGLDVVVVAGGRPVPDIDFGGASVVHLPLVEARDVETYRLIDERRRDVGWRLRWRRRRELLRLFHDFAPRAVVTDLFPFGRLQFCYELVPLLEAAARAKCVRISSMRDIVEPKRRAAHNKRMIALAERHFDRLLVHGDPSFIPFEHSLPAAARLRARLEYTGYAVEAPRAESGERNEVLISVGGGAGGERLLQTALAARPLSRFHAHPWRLLCGLNAGSERVEALRRDAPEGVIVEWNRQDFPALLGTAAVSVSQAGYNTTLELLAARVPAVLVPFARDGETEQGQRCRALAARGLVRVVTEDALTPASLAQAVDEACAPPEELRIDLRGAERTAWLVRDAVAAAYGTSRTMVPRQVTT
jgi:predicted glycosyltransferase